MGLFSSIFGNKNSQNEDEQLVESISDFWAWFEKDQKNFLNVVKEHKAIEEEFINPVYYKLNQIRKGAYLLVGMLDDHTAEVIFTSEGNLLNFPFINEIVEQAPEITNWQFKAFKPAMDYPDFAVGMGDKSFSTENVFFYADIEEEYADDICIKLTYSEEYTDEEKQFVENGTFIFVENYLGEVKMATQIDEIQFEHHVKSDVELVPIIKLSNYINWREKEFVEKYEGIVHLSEESNYTSLEWEKDDLALIGIVNSDLLGWDKKASHPWVMVIKIKFDGNKNNGMPTEKTLQSYYAFEDKLAELLLDKEGYVNVGRTTGFGERTIYYANKDYIKPIQIMERMQSEVDFEYEFEIFKDKYWRSMSHFELT